ALELEMEAHRREPAAGHDRAALALAERARARSLLDLLEESGAEVRQGVNPELGARRRDLEQRLEAKARRRLMLGTKDRDAVQRQALDEELRALAGDLDTVDAEIRRQSPRYAELVRPRPLTAAALQELLDPGTLMLLYSLGDERSYLWAVSRSSLHSFELPSRAVLEAAARQVHDAWRLLEAGPGVRQKDDAAGEQLSRLVLAPAVALLADHRLVVVADGALQYIPFGALPRPAAPGESLPAPERLLARHEIVSLPSASALAVQRQLLAGRPPAPRTVAVLADPVFQADDPRLSPNGRAASPAAARTGSLVGWERLAWSRTEADNIVRLAGRERSFVATDLDASLETLTSGRLRGYGIVHLATHGVMDARQPALSGLVLSLVDKEGRERPGFLSLPEIYNLDLGADLVVLSGCETALGKEVRGEGLIGLARGFQYAGAARVLASLWRVQDRATAELMRRFYEALLGGSLTPAAALRQAQLSMLRDRRWSDPYHWAGFALYGDWR
ncbi:MAG TPA: CHAT domain-containing protein, partial [Thermoanaerobaculia bacterium]